MRSPLVVRMWAWWADVAARVVERNFGSAAPNFLGNGEPEFGGATGDEGDLPGERR